MIIVRYQSSKGDYRTETMDFIDGRLVPRKNGTIISSRERNAVLRIGASGGAFMGSPLQSIAVDEQRLRSSPGYVGEGEILGYKAVILKNREQGVVSWIVPRFGKVPMRIESDFINIETVQLTPGEPPAELFSTEGVAETDTEGFEILLKTLPSHLRGQYTDQLGRFHETEERRRQDREQPNQ